MEVAEHPSVFVRSKRSWNAYALDPLLYRVKESRFLAFQIVMGLVAQRHASGERPTSLVRHATMTGLTLLARFAALVLSQNLTSSSSLVTKMQQSPGIERPGQFTANQAVNAMRLSA